MREDPIVDEVREARRQLLQTHGDDLKALFRALKEREAAGGRKLIRGQPKPAPG
jgi:hypothetical protein